MKVCTIHCVNLLSEKLLLITYTYKVINNNLSDNKFTQFIVWNFEKKNAKMVT